MIRQFLLMAVLLGFLSAPDHGQARTISVLAPQKIQDAVNEAQAGDLIEIGPGVYVESVYIDKPNITLQGLVKGGQWPHLEGEGRLNDAVVASREGFKIDQIAIAHYKGNGVMTQGADQVSVTRLIVKDTGIYGIYPTLGRNVRIAGNVVSGIADAGIYIGMCEHVDVTNNEVFANVAGIEIENSLNALVEGNSVYENTGGILVFALPGLPRKKTESVIIRNNQIYSNNHYNFGAAGSTVAAIPPGSGVIILAANGVQVEDNIIRDHAVGGIFVIDHKAMPGLTKDPEVNPNPEQIVLRQNLIEGTQNFSLKNLTSWYHYVIRSALAGNLPDDAAQNLLPVATDIFTSRGGQGMCIDHPESYRIVGAARLKQCPESEPPFKGSLQRITTMMVDARALQAKGATLPGEDVYNSVCSGCHAMDIQRIGPPVREIVAKYQGHPEGIVAFATAPKKVRQGFPSMPPQAYLGPEKLNQVAQYLLKRKI